MLLLGCGTKIVKVEGFLREKTKGDRIKNMRCQKHVCFVTIF